MDISPIGIVENDPNSIGCDLYLDIIHRVWFRTLSVNSIQNEFNIDAEGLYTGER